MFVGCIAAFDSTFGRDSTRREIDVRAAAAGQVNPDHPSWYSWRPLVRFTSYAGGYLHEYYQKRVFCTGGSAWLLLGLRRRGMHNEHARGDQCAGHCLLCPLANARCQNNAGQTKMTDRFSCWVFWPEWAFVYVQRLAIRRDWLNHTEDWVRRGHTFIRLILLRLMYAKWRYLQLNYWRNERLFNRCIYR